VISSKSKKASIKDIELNPHKFVEHLDKLAVLARGGDVYPSTVELDLVSFCNHHCEWCVDPQHTNHRLETSFACRLLSELNGIGVKGIVFKGGGEPTLHPDFKKILSYAQDLGLEVGVITNGSQLIQCYDAVVTYANYLRVSIDGPTETSHAHVHGSHDFSQIITGIQEVVTRRNQRRKRHPIIGLSFAMDHSLINEVGQAVRLGDMLGVNYIMFRPPFFEEVGQCNTMSPSEKQQLFQVFEQERAAYIGPMEIFIDYWISDSETAYGISTGDSPRRGRFCQSNGNGIEHVTQRCLASPLLAVVTADKQVYPCCNLRFLEEWSVGTICYDQGMDFKAIWSGEQRKTIMDRIHHVACLKYCTHPLSKYNEIIEYLNSPRYHKGFI
jgi:MoaA/NifB/PqqE/SkfB family radical SAM enzyme